MVHFKLIGILTVYLGSYPCSGGTIRKQKQ